MQNEQPTALRLANSAHLAYRVGWQREAKAEFIRLHELEKQYHELLYAVGNKYEGESRHQTALRYIQQAEVYDSAASAKAKKQP